MTDDPLAAQILEDQSSRTCTRCGRYRELEPSRADGLGGRVMWTCDVHRANSVVDPFEESW